MSQNYLIITGASRGIGLATAKLFIEKGYQVFNLSRKPCPESRVVSIPIDLANPDFTTVVKDKVIPQIQDAAKIVLVHNAALLCKDSVESIEADSLRNVLEIGVVAPTILNRLFLLYMSSESAIIYVGSTLSEKAVAGAFSYVVSKHTTIGLMRATCQDLLCKGITTACICPGFTDTPMLRNHLNNDEAILEQIKGMNAQNRLIQPEEIAETIYFAATNSVLNGAVLHANLGQKES
ncbi:MAG: SDR family oxidoreductase [Jaaginema sp. PMC 1079.18]|nr:SDR family oxidoreductase [Jaaginema sp. PMC 1080.18]MEC4851614.1 SDR family oxidoreductase [Jaaginema sp. PMC 1079.18]MEC4868934.1 SDR family oxidoreductase [Jaaginema sp. PMC 1078.18]